MVIFKKKMSSKPSSQKTILSEAFLSFSGMTLGSVFRYIFSIVMARLLGAQMLGIYSLGNAVTRIAEIFALMGLDNGVLRFVSRDTENTQNVNSSIYSSLKVGLLSSIVISIILFFSAELIVNNFLKEDKFLIIVIKLFSLSLPFSVLTLITSSATQAFKILKYKIFVNQIVNPLTLLIAFISSFYFLGTKLSILIPTVTSAIIGLIFILKFLRNFAKISFKNLIKSEVNKEILKFSIPLMFVSAIGIIMHWVDIVMLGILSNATDVGMYHPIDRTAGLVRMILFAFAGIFAPIFSENYFKKNIVGMKESYQSSSKYILTFSLPVFIFLFIFASPMLSLFGSEFQNEVALKILLTGIFVQTIFGLGSSTLSMSGNTTFNLINVSIALILNVALNYILIPQYGIIGAALSTAIALFILSILRFIENILILNLNLFSVKLLKPTLSGIMTFLIFIYLKSIFSNLFSLDSIFSLVIYLLAHFIFVCSTYLIIYFLLGFDKEDKELINSFKTKFI
tara:strand:+ start:953 stop:2485 length:1533 start_codon:yes stop_codon:yes gene_type:complete